MRSDRGSVWSALGELYDAALDRVEQAIGCLNVGRVDHQQPALAKSRATESAACRIVGNLWDRHVEALVFGIPRWLLDRQALARRDDCVVNKDLVGDGRRIEVPVAVRGEQCPKRRVLGVVRDEQYLAVRRQRHFVDPRGSASGDLGFGGGGRGRIQIDYVKRAVAVAGIE